MIGCTRQSVNKLLGMFTDDGLIRLERDRIVILDLDGLHAGRPPLTRSGPAGRLRAPPAVAQRARSAVEQDVGRDERRPEPALRPAEEREPALAVGPIRHRPRRP